MQHQLGESMCRRDDTSETTNTTNKNAKWCEQQRVVFSLTTWFYLPQAMQEHPQCSIFRVTSSLALLARNVCNYMTFPLHASTPESQFRQVAILAGKPGSHCCDTASAQTQICNAILMKHPALFAQLCSVLFKIKIDCQLCPVKLLCILKAMTRYHLNHDPSPMGPRDMCNINAGEKCGQQLASADCEFCPPTSQLHLVMTNWEIYDCRPQIHEEGFNISSIGMVDVHAGT